MRFTLGRAYAVLITTIAPPIAATAAVAGSGTFVACAPRAAVVETPIDLKVGSGDSRPTDGDGPRCKLVLSASPITKSSQSCYVEQQITEATGVLTYPCGGDGLADARFGPDQYQGHVSEGKLSLALHSELDWNDNCHWGIDHQIVGTLTSHGTPTFTKLEWKYADHVLTGENCSDVCEAHAQLEVALPPKPGEVPAGRRVDPAEPDDD